MFLYLSLYLLTLIWRPIHCKRGPPNIILIAADDIGFTEFGFNGGEFSPPILTDLANNGIKLNYHFTENVCSATRSSLLTGRYSWRSGLNNLIGIYDDSHTDLSLPLVSDKLSSAGYDTLISGKWHIGSAQISHLPISRGFNDALFFSQGAQTYYDHDYCTSWFLWFGQIELPLLFQLNALYPQGFCGYDLYDKDLNRVENNAYNEVLFANKIMSFIEDSSKKEPFFIYWAMSSPHWPLEDPPESFTECDNISNEGRKTFCNMLYFADYLIGLVLQKLRDEQLDKNTVIIFLSDNGPHPSYKPILQNEGFGQTLPFRGIKGSSFEGGVRTPAIIYSEHYLKQQYKIKDECIYNNMFHVADWYPIIMNLADINIDNDDIDGIDLWTDILSECSESEQSEQSEQSVNKRDEIISLRLCHLTDYFLTSYVRTNEWKLIVNGSIGFCPFSVPEVGYYVDFDGINSIIPNEDKYNQFVTDNENDEISQLYISECYEDYLDDNNNDDNLITNINLDETMLFKIDSDKIEACDVSEEYPDIVDELMQKLLNAKNNYNGYGGGQFDLDKSLYYQQINETYSCNTEITYYESFFDLPQYDNVQLTWDQILQRYIHIVNDCP